MEGSEGQVGPAGSVSETVEIKISQISKVTETAQPVKPHAKNQKALNIAKSQRLITLSQSIIALNQRVIVLRHLIIVQTAVKPAPLKGTRMPNLRKRAQVQVRLAPIAPGVAHSQRRANQLTDPES